MKPSTTWNRGIAIIGAEGSGKTTLINALEKRIEVPVMKEYVREVMRELGHSSPVQCDDLGQMKAFQDALARKRRGLELSFQGAFLSDRSPVDSFLYALSGVARDLESQSWLKQYHSESLRHTIESYQLLILVPHGRIGGEIAFDGVRSTLWFNALMMHYLFIGALPEFGVDHYTVRYTALEDRVEEVIYVLYQRGLLQL